jgi:hypothetical protein
MNLKVSDSVPLIGTIATFIANHFDMVLTRSIGVATLIFTLMKIADLWRRRNKPDSNDR